MPEFKFFVLTMAENFSTMILTSSYKIMASYINAHALTLPNRMGWLKERTYTYWKSFVPISFVPICHDPFGAKPSSLQHTLSIGFPLDVTLHQSDRLPMESNRSPPLVLQLQRTCFKMTSRQKKMISCLHEVKNQEEEMEPFYEILPASALVPHQSPAEEVIQLRAPRSWWQFSSGELEAIVASIAFNIRSVEDHPVTEVELRRRANPPQEQNQLVLVTTSTDYQDQPKPRRGPGRPKPSRIHTLSADWQIQTRTRRKAATAGRKDKKDIGVGFDLNLKPEGCSQIVAQERGPSNEDDDQTGPLAQIEDIGLGR
ncbi:unnamed protein product [Prunus armeniaca]